MTAGLVADSVSRHNSVQFNYELIKWGHQSTISTRMIYVTRTFCSTLRKAFPHCETVSRTQELKKKRKKKERTKMVTIDECVAIFTLSGVGVTVWFQPCRQKNIVSMTAIYFEWNGSPVSHWACLLSSGALRLADDQPGGVMKPRDWPTGVDEAGSFQLRLSRLAKSWRCSVQVKRNKRHKTENIYPGGKRRVRWKRTVRRKLTVWRDRTPKNEVFKSATKAQHLQLLGRKCRCVNHRSAPGARFVQRATWTAACFQASHQQRMKAFKRGESRFLPVTRHVYKPQSVCPPRLRCWFCLVCELFVASKCSVCLCFKFGGTASQLVISGGSRHGVHLAEWHAGGCVLSCLSPLCAPNG